MMAFVIKKPSLLTVAVLFCALLTLTVMVNWYFNFDTGLSENPSDFCIGRWKDSFIRDISDVQVKPGRSIFFLETSCRSLNAGKMILLPRQACSVEAAARRHPDTPVYVLFTAPGAYQLAEGEGTKVLKALLAYPNVDLLRLDVANFVGDTPVRELFLGGQIERSLYAVAHASDVLRFVTMYKYGGIYLDLDMIVMKNLWNLVPNFSGVDTNTSTAIGIMRFSHDGAGHEVAKHCLKELGETYDGKKWGYNGPMLLKRVLNQRCPEAKSISDLTALKDCKGFKIYPRNMFYKINWYERDWFFDPKKMNEVKAVEKESVALHLWNKDSASLKAPLNSDMPILHIARTYCPKVYEQVEGYF